MCAHMPCLQDMSVDPPLSGHHPGQFSPARGREYRHLSNIVLMDLHAEYKLAIYDLRLHTELPAVDNLSLIFDA